MSWLKPLFAATIAVALGYVLKPQNAELVVEFVAFVALGAILHWLYKSLFSSFLNPLERKRWAIILCYIFALGTVACVRCLALIEHDKMIFFEAVARDAGYVAELGIAIFIVDVWSSSKKTP